MKLRTRTLPIRLLARIAGLSFTMAILAAFSSPSAHATDDQHEQHNLSIVRAGFDAWAAGTGSPYDYLADDATWEITGNSLASRIYTSKGDLITNVIEPFNARMSGRLIPTVRHMYADGDTVITFFDAEGTASDGLPYRNTYAWLLTLRDSQIVKASAFFDAIAFNDLWQRVLPRAH